MVDIHIELGDMARWRRRVVVFLVACLFLWLANQVREIWLPLLISLLIAMVLDPLVDRMESRGWSRLKSAALIYLAFFAVLVTIITLAVPPLISQTTTITSTVSSILPSDLETSTPNDTRMRLKKLMHRFHASPTAENVVVHASSQINRGINDASGWLGRVAQAALNNLLWIGIIPLISFYALKDLHLIYARFLMLVPRDQRTNVQNILNEISVIFVRYLRGLTVVCALNAVATGIVLRLFGVPNAFGLGGISGVLYAVPYIGPALTILLVAGISFMAHKATFVIIIALIVLHNLLFDQIITPRILGQHVGLHPILSIVALLVGGSLLGIVGMVLAVPLTATVQMILFTIFPKMAAPIEVPAGEQLHQLVDQTGSVRVGGDQVTQTAEVHQTIIAAVDIAEDHEGQSGNDPVEARLEVGANLVDSEHSLEARNRDRGSAGSPGG